jgi:hypothetical protein
MRDNAGLPFLMDQFVTFQSKHLVWSIAHLALAISFNGNGFAQDTNFGIQGSVWGQETNGFRAFTVCFPGEESVSVFMVPTKRRTENCFSHPGIKFAKIQLQDNRGMSLLPLPWRKLVVDMPQELPLKDFPKVYGAKDSYIYVDRLPCSINQPCKITGIP